MAITSKNTDSWECNINGLPYGMYLYYIDAGSPTLSSVIGATGDNVFSCFYAPYVEIEELDMTRIPYDNTRFGKVSEVRPTLPTNPNVMRINSILKGSKFFNVRPPVYKAPISLSKARDWRNESKLYTYPYMYLTLYDGINEPMNLKPQYCKGTNLDIGVKMSLDDKLTTALFVQNYKGDTHGRFEALVMGANLELPTSSSNYANFVSRTRSTLLNNAKSVQESFIANNTVAENNFNNERDLSFLNSGVGALGNLLTGNFGGLLGNGSNLLASSMSATNNLNNSKAMNNLNKANSMRSIMGTVADSKTTPNTLLSKGSDIMYGLRNLQKYLKLFRFRQRDEYMQVLGDFFAMYGYAQNRIMGIDKRSRYYYNYVKTREINLVTDKVPNIYLEKLKSIYNNGVTIWHVDREGVTPCDYSLDNKEMN